MEFSLLLRRGQAEVTPDPGLCDVLRRKAGERRDWAVDALCRLIRAETVLGNEAPGQKVMAEFFSEMGQPVESFDCDPSALSGLPGYADPVSDSYEGRPNIVAVHYPTCASRGRSLVLNGHIDVVPAGLPSAWSSDRFSPVVREDRIYGRGAGDMKAGLVAGYLAFHLLKDAGLSPASRVIYQSVIEEECTGIGTLACLHRDYVADGAIIPEPFGQSVLVAQLGVLWVEVETRGRSAHVLDTSQGRNAILALYEIYAALQELEQQWNNREHRPREYQDVSHPINFNLGMIEGGDWPSSVPQQAKMRVRIAFYPSQTPAQVKRQITEHIMQALRERERLEGVSVNVSFRGHFAEGYCASPSEFFTQLRDAHAIVMGKHPRDLAATATTDSRFFHLYHRKPATCYGPVGGNFHGVDEWVDTQSMLDVAVVLALFMVEWCGVQQV
jgi:acetylornithine deacetylase